MCIAYVRPSYFIWQQKISEILREFFPTPEALASALMPSACSCPRCTAAVSNVDEDGENDSGSKKDANKKTEAV